MSRTRSTTTEAANLFSTRSSDNGGVTWTNGAVSDRKAPAAEAKRMTDEVSPLFHERRNRGEVIMNPLTSVSSSIRRDAAFGYQLRKYVKSSNALVQQLQVEPFTGVVTSEIRTGRTMMAEMSSADFLGECSAFGLDSGVMTAVEQRVLAKALEKATSPDTLSLVTAAEFDKTVMMVASAGRAVNGMARILESLGPSRVREFNNVLRRLSQLNKKQLAKQFLKSLDKGLQVAASSWLGYRYGVMATIYDVESWINASQMGAKRVRVTASEVTSYDSVPPYTTTAQWHAGWTGTGSFNIRVERRRRSVTTAGVIIDTTAFTNADRFGANRVMSTVWELIPYSFVLDWLIDAGTRISALEGGLSVRPLGSWITHEHSLQYVSPYYWTPTTGSDATYRYEASGADSGQVIENTMYRVRIPNPQLGVLPQVRVKLNWKRMTDSVGLLITAKSGFMKWARV